MLFMQKIGFRGLISLTTLLGIIAAAVCINLVSFGMLYREKLKDTWAILYLEMERRSKSLAHFIRDESIDIENQIIRPDAFKHLSSLKPEKTKLYFVSVKGAEGTFTDIFNPYLLSLTTPVVEQLSSLKKSGFFFGRSEDHILLGKSIIEPKTKKNFLTLSKIDLGAWFQGSGATKSHSLVYIMNKNSDLLYSNQAWLNSAEAASRPIVQKFINSPLGKSLSGYKDASDLFFYGFYYHIPGTDLAIFSELDFETATDPVRTIILRSLAICILIIALIILIIQFPLSKALRPLRKLTMLTRSVSDGVYNIDFLPSGALEFRFLGESFANMCQILHKKDLAIKKYISEIEDKIRMDRELEIAKQVQNNLLINSSIPVSTSLDLATDYMPASEVAGDWYGSWHDEKEACSIVAVADVSGHGVGSSMFTAIIAAAFDKYFSSPGKEETLPSMLTELNSRIYRLGKSGLHATMIVACIKNFKVTWYNAGHNFPLLIDSGQGTVRSMTLPSSPLGLEENFVVKSRSFELQAGHGFFIYTDGLIENKNNTGKMFGKNRMVRFFKTVQKNEPADSIIKRLKKEQSRFSAGTPPEDDTCLLFLKRLT